MLNYLPHVAIVASDLVGLYVLWRVRGKPLPASLEWLRSWPVTRWLCHRLESPVMGGL